MSVLRSMSGTPLLPPPPSSHLVEEEWGDGSGENRFLSPPRSAHGEHNQNLKTLKSSALLYFSRSSFLLPDRKIGNSPDQKRPQDTIFNQQSSIQLTNTGVTEQADHNIQYRHQHYSS